ncbi:hypothetical protein MC378_04950 [Polaribacter sp. MSW13]|uniref:DUF4129 domain-containing protein n=1 Tax=Polaribacter marinus TaxID=2916838 RepID=A0A9X1VPX1_9FLAO|nr:hypothetical protein [Polaribacter marinus]MCI2228505.1 hypothetical protein [Polaribacter marinus]
MKKHLFSLFLVAVVLTTYSQQNSKTVIETKANTDTIVYNKTTNFSSKKEFKDNLKEKYNSKDFHYTEEEEKAQPKEEENNKPSPISKAIVAAILFFFKNIFPFLLAAVLILIILKTFVGTDPSFWNFKRNKKKVAEKLIFQEEDIHEIDLDTLLKKAIQQENFRLAVRYYYLSILKKLSQNKLIDYHKDKTNSEYLFEIQNKDIRSQFSYLSYVYAYVWYGEFPIEENKFKVVENKYKSFFKSIS